MANQEPASAWIFGNSSVRVGTQGLFCPYLKTFIPPFLPTSLTAPGSPRMPASVCAWVTVCWCLHVYWIHPYKLPCCTSAINFCKVNNFDILLWVKLFVVVVLVVSCERNTYMSTHQFSTCRKILRCLGNLALISSNEKLRNRPFALRGHVT